MEVLAQTISYGHEYTVYSNDCVGQPYKVVRRNLRNGTEQTAFFANQELIDNLDDVDLDELLKCCEDRIFYRCFLRSTERIKKPSAIYLPQPQLKRLTTSAIGLK